MSNEEIRKKVKKIMLDNVVRGYSKTFDYHFTYTKPSGKTYPFQYFWDTCIHIFILCGLKEFELAKDNLRSLFAMQAENGFVGHILYWNNILPNRITDIFQSQPGIKRNMRSHMSSLIQPPLAAQALERIYNDTGDEDFLREMLPKLKKYYHWLAHNRDFDQDGMISIISYFEAGMDWKPSYDQLMNFEGQADWRLFLKVTWNDFENYLKNYDLRKIYQRGRFVVKDTGYNTIYAQNCRAMCKLCKISGDKEGDIFEQRALKNLRNMVEKMYDQETKAFYDLNGKTNEQLKVKTPTIFFPVVIKGIPEEMGREVVETHFFRQNEFHSKYVIPSLSLDHPAFNPRHSMYIWRGPTWVVYNWFLHQFFLSEGYDQAAAHLILSIKELITKSGFREYYNPFSGEGYGARDFTWSGLIIDMLDMNPDQQFQKLSDIKNTRSIN